ncbi:MAG: hypothetical protein R3F14_01810 [Polyangiaceae bacterium]
MEEVTTRTLPIENLTAQRAYAALRAKASTRSSFLIETSTPGARRSTIGFLVKSEAAHPAPSNVPHDLHATAAQLPPRAENPDLVAACFRDVLALIAFDVALPVLGAQPFPDLPFIAREMRDLTSIVFDHDAGTFTIVATNPNVVERVARTFAAAPELPALAAPGAGPPVYFLAAPPETVFLKQHTRAEKALSIGGIDRLMLARVFKSQPAGAELFDVYRALREASPEGHAFFIDLPATPTFTAFALAATGATATTLTATSPVEVFTAELLAALPTADLAGSPAKDALDVLRDMESQSRRMRGGAFVRARPGGQIDLLSTDTAVFFEEEQFQTVGLAPIVPGRDTASHTAACQDDALPALQAIRRAQDTAQARESESHN